MTTAIHLRIVAENMRINCRSILRHSIQPAMRPGEWDAFAWLAPKNYRLAQFYKDLSGWYAKRAALVDLSGRDYDDEAVEA